MMSEEVVPHFGLAKNVCAQLQLDIQSSPAAAVNQVLRDVLGGTVWVSPYAGRAICRAEEIAGGTVISLVRASGQVDRELMTLSGICHIRASPDGTQLAGICADGIQIFTFQHVAGTEDTYVGGTILPVDSPIDISWGVGTSSGVSCQAIGYRRSGSYGAVNLWGHAVTMACQPLPDERAVLVQPAYVGWGSSVKNTTWSLPVYRVEAGEKGLTISGQVGVWHGDGKFVHLGSYVSSSGKTIVWAATAINDVVTLEMTPSGPA